MKSNKHLSLDERLQITVLQGKETSIRKTDSLTSIQTAKSIVKAIKPYRNTIKSIIYDNGKEFSKHKKF